MRRIKATPHKDRLEALHVICLQIFRYLAQNLFDIRQYACIDFVQSNEKSDFASDAQSLCGIALNKHVFQLAAGMLRTGYFRQVIYRIKTE